MGRRRNINNANTRGGFTLVESVVTMVILAIIMVTVSQLFLGATQGYTAAAERGELHTAVSCAMDRIAMEIRNARATSGSSPASADITSTSASSIAWMDADGSSRSVSLSGTDLVYSEAGGAGSVLASNISSFSIATYDESNAALAASLSGAATASIRRVQITLVASHGGVVETLRTRVFPRACVLN